jgi:hypothetical protein
MYFSGVKGGARLRTLKGPKLSYMDITEDSLPLITEDSLPVFQSKVYHLGLLFG